MSNQNKQGTLTAEQKNQAKQQASAGQANKPGQKQSDSANRSAGQAENQGAAGKSTWDKNAENRSANTKDASIATEHAKADQSSASGSCCDSNKDQAKHNSSKQCDTNKQHDAGKKQNQPAHSSN